MDAAATTKNTLTIGSTQRLLFATMPSVSTTPERLRDEILANPSFGKSFTDHMIIATWTSSVGWHDAGLRPYGPISLSPSTAVLHYAQGVFEGLKAYRHGDGSIWVFRPEANAARFARSARRMALPELMVESFIDAIDLLVQTDAAWVPDGGESSLYLRPFMFASESFFGPRPAKEVTFCLIASPAGAYFATGQTPVDIWLSTAYSRAAPGGTGTAKCGGNYAAGLIAQQEAIDHGCSQVCFLDATERRWIEELGGMNLYFVQSDGTLTTPELTGTILEGITRESILTLARELGYDVDERRVSIEEWRHGAASGEITEVFACGTAAGVIPVGRLAWDGGGLSMGSTIGPVTATIRNALLDLQFGRSEDSHGWLHRVV